MCSVGGVLWQAAELLSKCFVRNWILTLLTVSSWRSSPASAQPSFKCRVLNKIVSWAGCGSRELQTWQLVRQGLIALPFKFGFGVTHRLLRADAGEDKEKLHLALALGAYWYLDYLAVDSTMQSRGLGTRALHTCIKLAQV